MSSTKYNIKIIYTVYLGIIVGLLVPFYIYFFVIRGYNTLYITSAILVGLYYISPAYIANGLAVIFGRRGHPIDGGKPFFDKRAIFGKGKTIEGFIGGGITGGFFGTLIYMNISYDFVVSQLTSDIFMEVYRLLDVLLKADVTLAFLLSFGALLGDLVGSFLKRRMNFPRGSPVPLLDQLDFLVGAILLGALVYVPPAVIILSLLEITIILHIVANTIAYELHLKSYPW